MLTLYINRLEKCKPLGTCPEFSGRKGFGRTGTGFWRGTEARQGMRQVGARLGAEREPCVGTWLHAALAPACEGGYGEDTEVPVGTETWLVSGRAGT